MTKDDIVTVLNEHNDEGRYNDVLKHIAEGDLKKAVKHFPGEWHVFPAMTPGLSGEGMAVPVEVSDVETDERANADVEAAYEELKRLATI